jgi:hypothetical protein
LIYGAPRHQDNSSGVIFEEGSSWTQPIYSCASAVKATVRTVSFTYNGTTGLLKDLNITNIQDKIYDNPDDMPIWGVEQTGGQYANDAIYLVWGLVSPSYQGNANVSTVQKSSLYLPGVGYPSQLSPYYSVDNLPGAEFFPNCLESGYNVGGSSTSSSSLPFDYSGETNIGLFLKWQNITQSASTAGLVQNLIFTDCAASLVVGTKSVSGVGSTASNDLPPVLVTPTVEVVNYNYLFGIPAFLVALAFLLSLLAAMGTVLFRRHNLDTLRLRIHQTSVGRIFTTLLEPERSNFTDKPKIWAASMGKEVIDLAQGRIDHGQLKNASPHVEEAVSFGDNGASGATKDATRAEVTETPEGSNQQAGQEPATPEPADTDAGPESESDATVPATEREDIENEMGAEASVLFA